MRTAGYVLSALLLLQSASASHYESAGKTPDEDLTKRVALGVELGNITAVLTGLLNGKPKKAAPTSEDELRLSLSSIWSSGQTNFYLGVRDQIDANITIPTDLTSDLVGPWTPAGSTSNTNPREPPTPIYPHKEPSDAPYSLPEESLRSAIFIPPSFTYGAKPPLILVPGTGTYGGEVFASNFIKLLSNSALADPVWLNIPGALLADVQSNGEHVAYAINYLSSISHSNVSLVTWSQGGLDTQWAFTYWPSTRAAVSDFIAVSPDFHGTVLAPVLCLSPGKTDLNPCAPSVIQQEYDSELVATLRSHGGADAYVPTTTLYSGVLDEIVEPQQGRSASAFLRDGRNVGVANVEAQVACPGQPAGSFYGHAGMLFSPLTAAAVADALGHDGPADLARLDLEAACGTYVAPGLSVGDAVATSGQIVVAAVRMLSYEPRLVREPALREYATA